MKKLDKYVFIDGVAFSREDYNKNISSFLAKQTDSIARSSTFPLRAMLDLDRTLTNTIKIGRILEVVNAEGEIIFQKNKKQFIVLDMRKAANLEDNFKSKFTEITAVIKHLEISSLLEYIVTIHKDILSKDQFAVISKITKFKTAERLFLYKITCKEKLASKKFFFV